MTGQRIDLHDIQFNLGTPVDNAYWYVGDWEGWDSPSQRQSFLNPTSQHGAVLTESLLGARALMLSGMVKVTGSEDDYWAAWNKALSLTNDLATPRRLKVYEGSVAKELQVLRAGEVRLRMLGGYSFEFEMPLTAMDPLKYASTPIVTTINAGASAALTNAGTFSTAKIVVEVLTSGTVVLHNDGTDQALTTGTTVMASGTVIDFRSRTAYLGDVNVYSRLAARNIWWELQPGTTPVENYGTANVRVTHYPAWV